MFTRLFWDVRKPGFKPFSKRIGRKNGLYHSHFCRIGLVNLEATIG